MSDSPEIPSDSASRIADAVESIVANVQGLRVHQSLSLREYTEPSNHDTRDAVERKFEKIVQAVLDIAKEILKVEGVGIPNRRKEVLAVLEQQTSVISVDLRERLVSGVAFRDVLAHTYGPITDDEKVYDALRNSVDKYVEFAEAVERYLETYTTG